MSTMPVKSYRGTLYTSDDLLMCVTCGTQYDQSEATPKASCRICDDPRQFVPPSGQSFTTLSKLKTDERGFKNVFRQQDDEGVWSIVTEPRFAIGQRAWLIQTPHGNILWDMVSLLDQDTVDKINSLGGLSLIIVSHPHFYSTWADWAITFEGCPVYLSEPDKEWINRVTPPAANLQFLSKRYTTLLPGITAIVAGGHFTGSMMLHADTSNTAVPSLFHADTIFTVLSAKNPDPGKAGVMSYAFMWSIPNMIPMHPDSILKIWTALKPFKVEATYGLEHAIRYKTKHSATIPERILESAKIVIKAMGYADHAIFAETIA